MEKTYFEGWYFKCHFNNEIFICIPGTSRVNGQKQGFIQVIFRNQMTYLQFDEDQIGRCDDDYIQLGKNIFTKQGLHLESDTINADLKMSTFTPLKYDIMGPLGLVKYMQCYHGIISLDHEVYGTIQLEDEQISVQGRGYIEKDKGVEFPKEYLWFQSNDFDSKASVVVAIAKIELGKLSFWGDFAVIYDGKKEYRLATYLGCKVVYWDDDCFILKQGNSLLHVKIRSADPLKLKAPDQSGMNRFIHEVIQCDAQICLYKKSKLIFDKTTHCASYEYCMNHAYQHK